MTRKIRFYNRDGRWYADLPEVIEAGGTEENNEMVSGANTWLDILSGNADTITLDVSDTEPLDEKLTLVQNSGGGADYIDVRSGHKMWLCEVTEFLFGHLPVNIFYQKAQL